MQMSLERACRIAVRAIYTGDVEMLRDIVGDYHVVRCVDENNNNLLSYVVDKKLNIPENIRVEMTRILGVAGIDLNHINKHRNTALNTAIYNEYPDVSLLLLRSPIINVNISNDEGMTPLMYACMMNDTNRRKVANIIYRLIQKGADVNYESDGNVPLSLAIELNDEYIIKILLAAGADPNYKNSAGKGIIESNYTDVPENIQRLRTLQL
jgi:ankyrin repeat protein